MQGEGIHPKYSRKFMQKSCEMMLNFIEGTLKGDLKLMDFKLPDQLRKDAHLQISEEGCGEEELINACKLALEHQAKPYHPHFHNQLFAGFDEYSMLGSMLMPAINGVVFTYEVSAIFTLMENDIYERFRQILDWDEIDATMTPGGSFANFMGMLLARFKKFPEANKEGVYGLPKIKVFTSGVSHYSCKKAALLTGIGVNNIVSVASDECGRIIPAELEKAIKKEIEDGNVPIYCNATLGTTVEGALDPLDQISQICEKYGVWCHMDAALGGAFLMSPKHVHDLAKSFKKVDSVTFDPHKGLVVPQQATFFFCRHVGLMAACNSMKADYLFHKERASYSGSLDVGDKHLQCGRCVDILKVWAYFKGNGWKGIAEQVDKQHELALYVKKYVEDRPERFKLAVPEVQTFNCCFWYIPEKMKKEDYASEDEFMQFVSKVTVLSKKFMINEGKILVGYSKSKSPYYFWRNVMSNPFTTHENIDYDMEHIAKYCEMAYEELTKKE